jgi:hypothetical protein
MSNVLFGPGATGIVGAAGGATHAAKDYRCRQHRGNLRMEKVHVLPPDGKLSLRRLFLYRPGQCRGGQQGSGAAGVARAEAQTDLPTTRILGLYYPGAVGPGP